MLSQACGRAFGVDIWTIDLNTLTQAFKVKSCPFSFLISPPALRIRTLVQDGHPINYSKLFYIVESLYVAVLNLTKLSILFFYLRVFPNKTFRLITHLVMAWVLITGIVFLFMVIFQCIPIDYIWLGWTGLYGPHRCLDINTITFVAAGFGIAQDVVILILPLPLLARLNVSRRSKLAIIFMFSLGIFAVVTSCVRLRYIVSFGSSVNPTWDYVGTLVWTGLELAVAIIIASLPAIRLLFTRMLPAHFATPGAGRSSPGSQAPSKPSVSFAEHARSGSMWSRSGTTASLCSKPQRRAAPLRWFSVLRGRRPSDPSSVLELGDKMHGKVQTRIEAGEQSETDPDHVYAGPTRPARILRMPASWVPGESSADECELRCKSPEIHVQTTMTRTSMIRESEGGRAEPRGRGLAAEAWARGDDLGFPSPRGSVSRGVSPLSRSSS